MALAKTHVHINICICRGQLQCIPAFTAPGKILYDSDFHYVSIEQAKHFADLLDRFIAEEAEGRNLEHLT
jgi:hypothetical protein